jgi:photosystem II stability/assembly factor-like uncharacterized protein
MNKIFFLPQSVNGQYTGWCSQSSIFRKTTNSGASWFVASPISASNKIFFINKDTGWICSTGMFKSTDGGINWINEPMPTMPPIVSNLITTFVFINKDRGWGVGGVTNYGGNPGIIWATTNGGLNWGYQQPDTSTAVFRFSVIDFVDSLDGWAYNANGSKGVHTINGGGQIIYTGISVVSTEVPNDFMLCQNYPNPFNPTTNIKYQIAKSSFVTIKIFDVLGREVVTLVNQKQSPGTFRASFDGTALPSGVYFYRVITESFSETKKMILVK